MADPKVKALKIKTGVVKRYTKEKVMYEKEAEDQQAKINKWKEEGKDEYFMKQQENVLKESQMMVPDCQRRLKVSYEELTKILETDTILAETDEFKAAQQVLTEAEPHLPKA